MPAQRRLPAAALTLALAAAPRAPWRLFTPRGECRLPVEDLSRTVSRGDVMPLTVRFRPAACPGGLRPRSLRLTGAAPQGGRWRAAFEAEGLRYGRLDADQPAAPLERIVATLRR